MLYKIKESFGGQISFKKGQVRLFTDAEVIRYDHLIENIGGESVNITDMKPNREFKKGRKKG